MWSLFVIVNMALQIVEPDYPVIWDTDRKLTLVVMDQNFDKLWECVELGKNLKENNVSVIDYQCRAEI